MINVGQKKQTQGWTMDAVGFRHSSCACVVPWSVPAAFQILVSGSGENWETTMIDDGAATNTATAHDGDGRPDCVTRTGLRKGTGERTSEPQTVCSALPGSRSQSGALALGHMS